MALSNNKDPEGGVLLCVQQERRTGYVRALTVSSIGGKRMRKEKKPTTYSRGEDKRKVGSLTEFQSTHLSKKSNLIYHTKGIVKIK